MTGAIGTSSLRRAPAGSGPALSPEVYTRLARIALREAGLAIPDSKADMVRTRLARRLRALSLDSYDAYCTLVEGPRAGEELGHMISALTTNVSHFFREAHHFDLLAGTLLPPLIERLRPENPIRIWSAGCANGQEPYSIAMTLAEAGLEPDDACRILATDIDASVVGFARAGAYPDHMLTGLSSQRRGAFVTQSPDGTWQIGRPLRDMIRFRVLNLLAPWPMKGRFDIVFCRNVVIYFDQPTQTRLWRAFARVLKPGGWLLLGHSERIDPGAETLFEKAEVTAYRRTDHPLPPSGEVS